MITKDAERCIDSWSPDLAWREELRTGTVTVAELIAQLKNREAAMVEQGVREDRDEDDELNWPAVERALEHEKPHPYM